MRLERREVLKFSAATLVAGAFGSQAVHAATEDVARFVCSSPVPRPYHSYLYAGIPTGLFAKVGIKPDLSWISGSAGALQLVVSGDGDIANLGILDYLAAKKKNPGLPLKMIYCQDYKSIYVLVVAGDSPIKKLADFKDKSIGVLSLGSGAVGTTKAMLRPAGLSPKDYQIIAVGPDAQAMTALQAGRVDALCFYIGSIAVMQNKGQKFRSFAADVPAGCFIASERFLKDKHDIAVRAMQGVALSTALSELSPTKAARLFYQTYPQGGVDVEKAVPGDANVIKTTCDFYKQIDDKHLWGGMTKEEWAGFVNFVGPDNGFTLADTPMADYFDDSLIAGINKVDIGLAVAAAKA